MKDLYLETDQGTVKIDPAMVEKYHLEAGTVSPFTRGRITDKQGGKPEEKKPKRAFGREETQGELVNDDIAQLDNGMTLQVSEMLDFTQGTDSSNG